MIETHAVVTRVEGDQAWVRVSERAGGCGRCDEPGGCRSIGLTQALKGPADPTFRLANLIGAKVGEPVLLRIAQGAPLRGALVTYGLGVALLLVGAACGQAIAPAGAADGFALVGAVAGLACTFAFNRVLHRSRKWRRAFEVEIAKDTGSTVNCPGPSA